MEVALSLLVPKAVSPYARITELLAENEHRAKWMCAKLSKRIIDFEAQLAPNEEVGARLVGTPDGSVFHVEGIAYWGPDLLIFSGKDPSGRPIELCQHVSQVSLVLVALAVSREGRRIGFLLQEQAGSAPE